MSSSKKLIIVFVKNLIIGQVKTRLAATVGNEKAFEVYTKLLDITKSAIENSSADIHIYFSKEIDYNLFPKHLKYEQIGEDLGQKMYNAFKTGFGQCYERIVLIGSDLPEMNDAILNQSFETLEENDFAFGPAIDGGYYLIGMKQLSKIPFKNMPWSTSLLYELTKEKITKTSMTVGELTPLNDIDTYEDYINSSIYPV